MPAASQKQSADEVRRAYVDLAFDEAYKIREELYGPEDDDSGTGGLYARRKANRNQLRQLRDQGMLTDEQREELAELYPLRAQKKDEDAEIIEDDANGENGEDA